MTHTILGDFDHSSFPNIYLDGTISLPTLQLVKLHERVHQQLEYASAYGLFTTFLIFLREDHAESLPRLVEIDSAINALMTSQFLVQEGCATFLTLQVCGVREGPLAAQNLVKSLPGEYKAATSIFERCIVPRGHAGDVGNRIIRMMEFAITAIALAALNGNICNVFKDFSHFTFNRLVDHLQEDSPNQRLVRITEFLSEGDNRDQYFKTCEEAILAAAGPNIDYFDTDSMRGVIEKNPLEWDHLHAHMLFTACQRIIQWLGVQGVVTVDPSYSGALVSQESWSPFVLTRGWEAHLGLTDRFEARFVNPLSVSKERHAALVHTMNYSIKDSRRVRPYFDVSELTDDLRSVCNADVTCVIRTLYVPKSTELPSPPRAMHHISEKHRYVVDIAIYKDLECIGTTLFTTPISADEIGYVVPPLTRSCVLLQYSHYKLILQDAGYEDLARHSRSCFVFFLPGEIDIVENILGATGPVGPNQCTVSFADAFEYSGINLPNVILVERMVGGAKVRFFCLADEFLMATYRQLLSGVATERALDTWELLQCRQCAIEACYGIASGLDRVVAGNA